MLPDLLRARDDGRLYKFQDTHWNAVGNAAAAPPLADFLVRRLSGGEAAADRGH